jgi:hypothetical protein
MSLRSGCPWFERAMTRSSISRTSTPSCSRSSGAATPSVTASLENWYSSHNQHHKSRTPIMVGADAPFRRTSVFKIEPTPQLTRGQNFCLCAISGAVANLPHSCLQMIGQVIWDPAQLMVFIPSELSNRLDAVADHTRRISLSEGGERTGSFSKLTRILASRFSIGGPRDRPL